MDISDDFDWDESYYTSGPGGEDYSNEGQNYVNSGEDYSHEGVNYPTYESTQPGAEGTGGSPINIPTGEGEGGLSGLWNAIKGMLTSGKGQGVFGSGIGLLPLILGALAMKDRPQPTGGGTTQAYQGPKQYNRQVVQTRYGPVLRYAAGGPVAMEDGGFVMTKRAVDGAGGPSGIQNLVPGARMIRGPGTGTSDDVPAIIVGRKGTTPAALSNGEAYVPKSRVQQMGGAQKLYALMNSLQNRG